MIGEPSVSEPSDCTTPGYFDLDFGAGFLELLLDVLASVLFTPALTSFGAPSTRSLASLRPRPVTSRTTLMTPILFAPPLLRTTVNSVFSSAAAAGAAAAAASRSRRDGDRRRLDAPLVLERLRQVDELDDR